MKTYHADPADHDAVAAALLEKYLDVGAKCKCGTGLNHLALLSVEDPKGQNVELVLACSCCDRTYSAFLPLDRGVPAESGSKAARSGETGEGVDHV
ncbi:hypothetical protein [Sulfurimicrobium lacus]|nr:hypothetical protein [Sulfurimicrobium lacus]